MKSHLLAKKRRREDLNLAVCWTVSVTVPLCWTSTNIISMCNILYLQCIKWLQFCTVKVRYLGCTRGRFLLRQASQNLELFAKILPSNENNTAAGMARYLVSAAEANFFNRWSLVFICHASLARTQYLIQRLWIIDEISFKSKVECCKIGIYMKVLSTTL